MHRYSRSTRTKDTIENVRAALQWSPHRSVRRYSLARNIPRTSLRRISKKGLRVCTHIKFHWVEANLTNRTCNTTLLRTREWGMQYPYIPLGLLWSVQSRLRLLSGLTFFKRKMWASLSTVFASQMNISIEDMGLNRLKARNTEFLWQSTFYVTELRK